MAFCGLAFADINTGLKAHHDGNYPAAYHEFLPLAEHGDIEAEAYVGGLLLEGKGVERNEAEGVKWIRRAAEAGSTKAQALLGAIYDQGWGVRTDQVEAAKWFRW